VYIRDAAARVAVPIDAAEVTINLLMTISQNNSSLLPAKTQASINNRKLYNSVPNGPRVAVKKE